MTEPEIGALFPRNWLPLRFQLSPPAGQSLFEIRLHVPNQSNDLVVYTMTTQWTLPADLWGRLIAHSVDLPITVSVRGAVLRDGALVRKPMLGSSGDITIAPVNADGNIVYWTARCWSSRLSAVPTQVAGFMQNARTVEEDLGIAPPLVRLGVKQLAFIELAGLHPLVRLLRER